jgi:hypothetical protein
MAAAKIVGEEPKMSAFSGTSVCRLARLVYSCYPLLLLLLLVHKYVVKKQIKNMHFFFPATQYWYMRIV